MKISRWAKQTPKQREAAKRGQRVRHIYRTYGLTQFDYEERLQAQNCACALCLVPFTKTPHVDHCYSTGVVRGILCAGCNSSIGQLRDDPAFIRRAADYVEYHRGP